MKEWGLSDDEIAEAEGFFDAIDTDNSGNLDADEVTAAWAEFEPKYRAACPKQE